MYVGVLLAIIAVFIGWWLFSSYYTPPTCFDGNKNGLEAGPDCGGECQYLCPFQVAEPVVLFSRAFKVSGNVYNAIAYVENPNFDIASEAVNYTFTFYDAQNNKITERKGSTFISAGRVSPVFEGGIIMGDSVPTRTIFELTDDAFASGDKRLVNHKQYYFTVLAYAHNEYLKYEPVLIYHVDRSWR